MPVTNEVGRRYGRLWVTGRANNDKYGRAKWHVLCACGNTASVLGVHLRSGHTESCGCLQKERLLQANVTHGHASEGQKSSTYQSWLNMLQRTGNEKCFSPLRRHRHRRV